MTIISHTLSSAFRHFCLGLENVSCLSAVFPLVPHSATLFSPPREDLILHLGHCRASYPMLLSSLGSVVRDLTGKLELRLPRNGVGNWKTEGALHHLASVVWASQRIQTLLLDLSHNDLGPNDLLVFFPLVSRSSNLRSLTLDLRSNPRIGFGGLEHLLRWMGHYTSLRSLNLYITNIGLDERERCICADELHALFPAIHLLL